LFRPTAPVIRRDDTKPQLWILSGKRWLHEQAATPKEPLKFFAADAGG
jgi:hypothetical protein